MLNVVGCLVETHDLRLVVLAAATCGLSALTTVCLVDHARRTAAWVQVGWLAVAAFAGDPASGRRTSSPCSRSRLASRAATISVSPRSPSSSRSRWSAPAWPSRSPSGACGRMGRRWRRRARHRGDALHRHGRLRRRRAQGVGPRRRRGLARPFRPARRGRPVGPAGRARPRPPASRRAPAAARHLRAPFHRDGRRHRYPGPDHGRLRGRGPERVAGRRRRAGELHHPPHGRRRARAGPPRPPACPIGGRPPAQPRQRRRRGARGLHGRHRRQRQPQLRQARRPAPGRPPGLVPVRLPSRGSDTPPHGRPSRATGGGRASARGRHLDPGRGDHAAGRACRAAPLRRGRARPACPSPGRKPYRVPRPPRRPHRPREPRQLRPAARP